jgi:NADH dehydrogenase
VAPVAIQQGHYAGTLIHNRLMGRRTPPFRYRDKGNLATIGRGEAVADLHVVRLSGPLAWWVWLFVHLWYLIGFRNRLLVTIQWSISFFTHGRGERVIGDMEAFEPVPAPGAEAGRRDARGHDAQGRDAQGRDAQGRDATAEPATPG